MAAVSNGTPLIAFDAVVIDTETTSFDSHKARIVEIAAVRLKQGLTLGDCPLLRKAANPNIVRLRCANSDIRARAIHPLGRVRTGVAGAKTWNRVALCPRGETSG